MKLSHFLYLLSVIIFCGTAGLILWERNKRVLKRYELILFILAAISVPFAASDYFALHWQAWFYYPSQTLGITFGVTRFETYILALVITFTFAAGTLILAAKLDRNSRKKNKQRKK